jgi:hypothetical protein
VNVSQGEAVYVVVGHHAFSCRRSDNESARSAFSAALKSRAVCAGNNSGYGQVNRFGRCATIVFSSGEAVKVVANVARTEYVFGCVPLETRDSAGLAR